MLKREEGAVVVVVAVLMPVFLLLMAGGVSGFSLMGAHRELQKAADQAALAGASSMPPMTAGVLTETSPFPLAGTSASYSLDQTPTNQTTGRRPPRMGDLMPDPRAVACAYGSAGLSTQYSKLVGAFENPAQFQTPVNASGGARTTVCQDRRVFASFRRPPVTSSQSECTSRLVELAAQNQSTLQPQIDPIVKMPLGAILPVLLTQRVHVDVYSHLEPPLLSVITGELGRTVTAGATAYSRVKNAVVAPIIPADQQRILKGQDPIPVITDPVRLNEALRTPQTSLLYAIEQIDVALEPVMGTLGLPCRNLFYNLLQTLREIYDAPGGSAVEVTDSTVTSQDETAAQAGASGPDPTEPDSLAGEVFFVVGVSTAERSQDKQNRPVLDVALVLMHEISEGEYRASVLERRGNGVVWSNHNAQGAFRATLVQS